MQLWKALCGIIFAVCYVPLAMAAALSPTGTWITIDDKTGDNRYSKENFNKNEFFFIEKLKEWDIVPKEIEIIELQDRYVTTVAEIGGEQAYIVMEK